MSRATVELDFFGMERDSSAKSPFPKFCRQKSLLAISKVNPQILKSVIASGSSNQLIDSNKSSVPSTPKEEPTPLPILPVYSPLPRPSFENAPQSAPLTIFYNGTVSVFNVHPVKAETILKLAENGISKSVVGPSSQQQMLGTLDGDLPITRRKSLQRFLEKRKERLTSVSPYASMPSDTHS